MVGKTKEPKGASSMAGKPKETDRPVGPKTGMIRARVEPGLKAKVEDI